MKSAMQHYVVGLQDLTRVDGNGSWTFLHDRATAVADLLEHLDHLIEPDPPIRELYEFGAHKRMPAARAVVKNLADLI